VGRWRASNFFLLHTLFSSVRQINGCWVLIISSRQFIKQPYALMLLFVVNYAYLRLRNSSIWQFLPVCSRLLMAVWQSLQDCWRLRPSSYMRFSSIMNPYLSNSTSAIGLQFTLWDSLISIAWRATGVTRVYVETVETGCTISVDVMTVTQVHCTRSER